MLVLLDVQSSQLGRKGIALTFKALVESVAEQNRLLMSKHPLPALYESGVVFRNEPWCSKFETLATAPVVYRRGWGDCAHLVAWRIAELRNQGVAATCKIYWRVHKKAGATVRLFHVEVRLPDGSVEDPSRFLGM
jgi:hypothetical protein